MASYINPASTSKTLALFLATDSDSSGVYGHVFDDPEHQAGDSLHSISSPESGFETGLYHHVSAYRSMFTDRVSKHTRMAAVVSVRHSRRQLGLDDSCHLYRSEHGPARSNVLLIPVKSLI